MKKKAKQLGPLERTYEISPQYLAKVIFIAALSFIFFLGMLLGFYIRENIGYFILSSAFLVVYIITMVGWFVLKKQRLSVHEYGISYRSVQVLWNEISGVDQPDARSFRLKSSDGRVLQVSDAVYEWEKVRQIVSQRTGF